MTEKDYIRLVKMVADKRELLQLTSESNLREEISADIEVLDAACGDYEERCDFDTEIQDLKKVCTQKEAVAKSLKDETNKLRYELGKLHAELEKAKKPKPCFEVLFSDGSSTCVENAVSWNVQPEFTRLKDGDGNNVAIFMSTDVRGIIERGKWENDED